MRPHGQRLFNGGNTLNPDDPRILDAALQLLRAPHADRPAMLARVPEFARADVQERLEALRMEMEERAAIREYDGEMTRAEAERLTRLDYGVPE
jgi:hypothetical protein